MNKYYYIAELQQAWRLNPDGRTGITFRIQGSGPTDFRVEYASFGTRTADFLKDEANTRLTKITEAEYNLYEAKFWKYVQSKADMHSGSTSSKADMHGGSTPSKS